MGKLCDKRLEIPVVALLAFDLAANSVASKNAWTDAHVLLLWSRLPQLQTQETEGAPALAVAPFKMYTDTIKAISDCCQEDYVCALSAGAPPASGSFPFGQSQPTQSAPAFAFGAQPSGQSGPSFGGGQKELLLDVQ